LERRPYAPGTHGPKARRKHTEYGLALMEKQKLRFYYGLAEKQFRGIYQRALRQRGITGETMVQMLESRLDNIVYQLGFSNTRAGSRQMVGHGHVAVNGRKVNIPSYNVKVNDVVEVRDTSRSRQMALRGLEISTSRSVPAWLDLNKDAFKGTLLRIPTLEEIQPISNVQTVVEFYSR